MSYITFPAGHVPRSGSGKASFWRDAFAAFEASGQSVSSFCQARGLKVPTFYAWRLRLKATAQPSLSPGSSGRHSASPAFLPVVVEPRSCVADETLQVELRGGRVLRLPASMPAARLAEVLHALEGQA
jgi:hypothetical protein